VVRACRQTTVSNCFVRAFAGISDSLVLLIVLQSLQIHRPRLVGSAVNSFPEKHDQPEVEHADNVPLRNARERGAERARCRHDLATNSDYEGGPAC